MSVRLHGTFGSWILPEGRTVLGRGAAAGLRIDDPRLSRSHARFTLEDYRLRVEDLGATNGVLVDGVRISGERELVHGSVVVCGPVILMVAVDRTTPHPRSTEGGQDPATRRLAPRADTENMSAITAADRPSTSGRGLDPAIAAAVSSGERDPARQSSLQPADMSPSITSPLAAIRPDRRSGNTPPSRRSPTTTSSLEPPHLAPTASGALEAPKELPGPLNRLLAGAGDGLLALVAGVPAAIVLAAGYGFAAAAAGAVMVGGLPRLVGGSQAGAAELAASVFAPGGASRAFELVPMLAQQPGPRLVLVAACGLAALAATLGFLLVLVRPSIDLGAPPVHRRLGIAIVRRDGSRPGWVRSGVRWTLAALLWPLAIPLALAGRRSVHDLLTGCTLQRTR